MRAHRPPRLGATTISRPPGASTRQHSSSISVGFSAVSMPCTTMIRSIVESSSGSMVGSISVDAEGPVAGQFTTPCCAGMKAISRSERSLNSGR